MFNLFKLIQRGWAKRDRIWSSPPAVEVDPWLQLNTKGISWKMDPTASTEDRLIYFHDEGLHYPHLRLWLERGEASHMTQTIDQVLRAAEAELEGASPVWVTLEDGQERYISVDDAAAGVIRNLQTQVRRLEIRLDTRNDHVRIVKDALCELQDKLTDLQGS